MVEVGSKQVEVHGLDDKREITAFYWLLHSLDSFSPLNSFMQVKLPGVTLARAFIVAGISIIVQLTGVLKIQCYSLNYYSIRHCYSRTPWPISGSKGPCNFWCFCSSQSCQSEGITDWSKHHVCLCPRQLYIRAAGPGLVYQWSLQEGTQTMLYRLVCFWGNEGTWQGWRSRHQSTNPYHKGTACKLGNQNTQWDGEKEGHVRVWTDWNSKIYSLTLYFVLRTDFFLLFQCPWTGLFCITLCQHLNEQ